MKKINYINFIQVIIFSLISHTLLAQIPSKTSSDCDCLTNLDYFMNKIKKNYIGYSYMTQGKEKKLEAHTDSLRKIAKEVGDKNCIPTLDAWAKFFNDPHIEVSLSKPLLPFKLTHAFFAEKHKIAISEEEVQAYFKQNSNHIDPVEGIWISSNGKTKLAVIREKNKKMNRDFVGFTLAGDTLYWAKGEIRMEIKNTSSGYQTLYYHTDHKSYLFPFELQKKNDSLLLMNFFTIGATWSRQFPKSKVKLKLNLPSKYPSFNRKFTITQVNPETLLLSLPAFDNIFKKTVDSLITANYQKISSTPNLIIDIHNNGGGSIFTYESILPFLYTKPIIKPEFTVLASDDNIALAKTVLKDSIRINQWDEWQQMIHKMEQKRNQLFTENVDTIKFDKILPFPKKIAVLISQSTASAAEFFVLDAMQSDKVKIFGMPTAGAIAFAEYVNENTMLCPIYKFHYPIAQVDALLKQGGGRTQIKPNEYIPDHVKDWIQWTEKRFIKW